MAPDARGDACRAPRRPAYCKGAFRPSCAGWACGTSCRWSAWRAPAPPSRWWARAASATSTSTAGNRARHHGRALGRGGGAGNPRLVERHFPGLRAALARKPHRHGVARGADLGGGEAARRGAGLEPGGLSRTKRRALPAVQAGVQDRLEGGPEANELPTCPMKERTRCEATKMGETLRGPGAATGGSRPATFPRCCASDRTGR